MRKLFQWDVTEAQHHAYYCLSPVISFRNVKIVLEGNVVCSLDSNGFYHGLRIWPDGSYRLYNHGMLESHHSDSGYTVPAVRNGDGSTKHWYRGVRISDEIYLPHLEQLAPYITEFSPRARKYSYSLAELPIKEKLQTFYKSILLTNMVNAPRETALVLANKYTYGQVYDMIEMVVRLNIDCIADAPEQVQQWFGLTPSAHRCYPQSRLSV